MVIAAIGTVLAAGYLLWMLQKTAFGKARKEFENSPDVKDIKRLEYVSWAPLLVLIVVLGFYPRLLHEATDPAVRESLVVESVQGSAQDCLTDERGVNCFEERRREARQNRAG